MSFGAVIINVSYLMPGPDNEGMLDADVALSNLLPVLKLFPTPPS
jgi:hypothetical protein